MLRALGTDCHPAATARELAAHYAVRHRVFVDEQRIFHGTDRDARDDDQLTIHADRVIGGAVRLYPLDEDGEFWQGDRLAVLPEHRARGLGTPLVRYAVRTATERGGLLMVAHIQLRNVGYFQRLGWRRDGDVELYAGLPHQPMAIDLRT
ncbi:MSMEG_0567/Sll0786 family nitrogen starvation N-acetyltransferase [Nocardia aurea]|uniref:MSMEG_0567/Sll0786 family nitrogen starvation N-acetyltransferase n=1 Tax=Nocardia aurea TaxID=2144174 RepID=UPI000D68B545|nr:MSMEG_0567/Sll0786 family nitrogen starvation N-acetyltransferase [Nocardia aurea]